MRSRNSSRSAASPCITARCSTSPAASRRSASSWRTSGAGAGPPGLLHHPSAHVDERLDRQHRGHHGLGPADAATLLQVVQRVEGGQYVGPAQQLRGSPPARHRRRHQPPPNSAASSTNVPSPLETDRLSTTWTGNRPSKPAAAVFADWQVLDSWPEMVRQTTASAPASSARRKAASKAPGDGQAVWGRASVGPSWRRSRSTVEVLPVGVLPAPEPDGQGHDLDPKRVELFLGTRSLELSVTR